MNGNYLLDTNVIISLFAGDQGVLKNLASAAQNFVPSIAIGELYFGAFKSANASANLARIDELVSNSVVLNCDVNTARHYGEIKKELKEKGHPIPENDIWIAAIAFQHDLTLVTRDQHFNEIEKLGIVSW